MNKADLITRLEPVVGSRSAAAEAVETVVDAIIREVSEGGSVTITGFGTFEKVERAARTGRNPRTGEAVPIAATASPAFRAGTLFRHLVATPEEVPAHGLVGGRAPATRRSGTSAQVARAESGDDAHDSEKKSKKNKKGKKGKKSKKD